ncbi:uncharacterized protein LOC129590682 [Paramacrobiotus metropolitanus]|uniref:uncharacterized protein LOC129590682 n=1 Tax=Paramacrobiotus metropolitanus TaxID=2943436 RepID=UPI0024459B02|nr:uncharacterized protein LOC129590682 [Paramacrobiotus metropolitanus]
MLFWVFLLFAFHGIASTAHGGLTGLPTISTDLETDCSPQPLPAPNDQLSTAVIFPFRTDLLTAAECAAYGRHWMHDITFWEPDQCQDPGTATSSFNPRRITYVPVRFIAGTNAINATRLISTISPTRAVTVTVECNDLLQSELLSPAEDALHTDVFQPIRRQVVELSRRHCSTPDATYKMYSVGLLPSLIRLEMRNCYNMTIKKRDFALMPQLRVFEAITSSIAEIEAHTFTDLVNLRSLMLERGLSDLLWYGKTGPVSLRTLPSKADMEHMRRLHCDCFYAWLRNFLKTKPYLLQDRGDGEVAIVGNYRTTGFGVKGEFRPYLNVDCSLPLNFANLPNVPPGVAAPFAYNMQCYNLTC